MSNRPSRQAARKKDGQVTHVQPSSDGGSKTLWWWVGGGLVALVAIALIVAMATGGDDGGTSGRDVRQVAFVEVDGSPLVPYASVQGGVDTAVGTPAPGFSASEFDNTEHVIVPGDGTARMIGFFAHWCPHCQAELPRLTSWLNDNEVPEGVEIIAVSTSVDEGSPNYPPSSWFEREDWPELTLRDSPASDISNAYGLSGYPYFVVVDGEGNVLRRVSGELTTEAWEELVAEAAASVA